MQFWLRSPAYGTVQKSRPPPLHRRSERSRRPRNPQTNIWKACWGQPLTSSNLVSSASASPGTMSKGSAVRSGALRRLSALVRKGLDPPADSNSITNKTPLTASALRSIAAAMASRFWTTTRTPRIRESISTRRTTPTICDQRSPRVHRVRLTDSTDSTDSNVMIQA